MLETHTPFYQSGLGDQLEHELTFNDYDKVIKSTNENASYVIANICLEVDIVSDAELVRQFNQQYIEKMAVFYDRVFRYKDMTKQWNNYKLQHKFGA